MTYDRVLLANGWSGEYHGKYHSPYNYSRDEAAESYYSRPVQCETDRLFPLDRSRELLSRGFLAHSKHVGMSAGLNGGTLPINPPRGVLALADAYRAYMDAHEPLRPLQRGQLLDGMYRRPCKTRCSMCLLDLCALCLPSD